MLPANTEAVPADNKETIENNEKENNGAASKKSGTSCLRCAGAVSVHKLVGFLRVFPKQKLDKGKLVDLGHVDEVAYYEGREPSQLLERDDNSEV